jgi:microcystin-dependent protein
VGAIIPYAGGSAPMGFFMCNGDQVSRSTYSVLYAVIGTNYGDGDGSTTYHLPDMRGRFLRGVDGSAGRDPDKDNRTPSQAGGNGGNNIGSVQGHEVQGHTHTYLDMNPNSKVEVDNPDTFGGTEFPYDTETNATRTTNSTGGNETRPVNIYVNYIIRH